jgi:transcriptional regulator with XRE-family HTH domain
MRDFATAEGVSVSHVSQVLSGKRESRTMDEKIAAFTEKNLERSRSRAQRSGWGGAGGGRAESLMTAT